MWPPLAQARARPIIQNYKHIVLLTSCPVRSIQLAVTHNDCSCSSKKLVCCSIHLPHTEYTCVLVPPVYGDLIHLKKKKKSLDQRPQLIHMFISRSLEINYIKLAFPNKTLG